MTETTDDVTHDTDAISTTASVATAVTSKVDEIIGHIRGQQLVDGSWLSDQLLDVSLLAPLSPVAGEAFKVVHELAGRSLVDRKWAVDQLLDLRALVVERRN